MNSAINELIPARVRGWVDLAVNGSYWIGAVLASAVSIGLLDTSRFRIDIGKRVIIYFFSSLCSIRLMFFQGWRLPFAIGGGLGLIIIFLRLKFIPESPRWLIIHERYSIASPPYSSFHPSYFLCRMAEAEQIVSDIERKVYKNQPVPEVSQFISVSKKQASLTEIAKSILTRKYPTSTSFYRAHLNSSLFCPALIPLLLPPPFFFFFDKLPNISIDPW